MAILACTYDKLADAAYLYLTNSTNNVKQTLSINANLNLDIGMDNKLYGIEILNVKGNLSTLIVAFILGITND